jgi:alpha/beta hydrolase fold
MSRTATQTTIGAAADVPRRSVENLPSVPITTYRTVSVDGLKVFYREAGNPNAPVVVLLHGFPTSSHMYRELILALADHYHVAAPDPPGFGFSDAPDRKTFKYRGPRPQAVCPLRLRLWSASGLSIGHASSGADHRADLAERQCLSGRIERGLEPDPGVLEGPFAGKPFDLARLPEARDHAMAVHAWDSEP